MKHVILELIKLKGSAVQLVHQIYSHFTAAVVVS